MIGIRGGIKELDTRLEISVSQDCASLLISVENGPLFLMDGLSTQITDGRGILKITATPHDGSFSWLVDGYCQGKFDGQSLELLTEKGVWVNC